MPKIGLIVVLLSALPGFAQTTDKTLYAKQFPGTTVAAKVRAAMAHCAQYTATTKCYVVIEPSLAIYPAGEALPQPCEHCVIVDKRLSAVLQPTGNGNQVVATPSDGSSGGSSLRSIVPADLSRAHATNSGFGVIQPDGTTIQIINDRLTAIDSAAADAVTGSGTTGYLACWTGTNSIAGSCPLDYSVSTSGDFTFTKDIDVVRNVSGPSGIFVTNTSTADVTVAETEYINSNGDSRSTGTWLSVGINSTGYSGAAGTVNAPSMAYWWADHTTGLLGGTRDIYLKGGGGDNAVAQMHLANGSDVLFPYLKAPTGATYNLTVDSSGKMASSITYFSAAGTALPTCSSTTKGARETVIDAANPTYHGAYMSGGTITSSVICSYNGSTYSWLTD